jgi:uncharacterized protein (TIGR02588 family)
MLRVTNHGGQTAARVNVEGELRGAGGALETRSAMINYVPAGSERQAGLFFSHDPRQYDVQLWAEGYEQP